MNKLAEKELEAAVMRMIRKNNEDLYNILRSDIQDKLIIGPVLIRFFRGIQ